MAFPEPTPPVKGRAAREFAERLDSFSLTPKQKGRFRKVKEAYERKKPSK